MLHTGDTLEKAAKEADIVTMGVKPSAMHIHKGHQVTVTNFFRAVLQNSSSKGLILVEDREFDFRHMPSLHPAVTKQTFAIREKVKDVLVAAAEFYDERSTLDRIDIRSASDLYGTLGPSGELFGLDFYHLLLESRNAIREHFGPIAGKKSMPYIRTVCDTCHYGHPRASKMKFERDFIRSECHNADQHDDPSYEVWPGRGQTNWTTYYALGGLRDPLIARGKSLLHLYGGDFLMDWGKHSDQKRSQAERISHLVRCISPRAPIDHFAGPLITHNGIKLAKSRGDRDDEPDMDLIHRMLESKKPVIDLTEEW